MNKANFGAWDTGEHHMVVESEDEELPKVSHLVSSWTQKSQTLGILELDRTSVTIQLSALSYEELTHRHPPQMASSGQVILGFLDTQTQMVVPCGVVTSSPPCGPPTTVQPWTNLISLLLPRQQNFMILGSFLMLYSLPPKSDNPTFISSKKKKNPPLPGKLPNVSLLTLQSSGQQFLETTECMLMSIFLTVCATWYPVLCL